MAGSGCSDRCLGSQHSPFDERRVPAVEPDDERVDERYADVVASRLELLRDRHIGPARLQIPGRVVVGDEHAPDVAQQAEPEYLPWRGDRGVDGPDVADAVESATARKTSWSYPSSISQHGRAASAGVRI